MLPQRRLFPRAMRRIRAAPVNETLLDFYLDCTPGYFNMEGRAQKSEDIFFGGRYGDGPIPFFNMLVAWQAEGSMAGFVVDKADIA